jgi:hypothetical protein
MLCWRADPYLLRFSFAGGDHAEVLAGDPVVITIQGLISRLEGSLSFFTGAKGLASGPGCNSGCALEKEEQQEWQEPHGYRL